MERREKLNRRIAALKEQERVERETRCLFAAILRAHALRQGK